MGVIEDTAKHKRHFTVTGYVVNKDHTKMLMIHHKKLGKWLPPGGHLEENELPHEGAMREVFEETGVRATPVDMHDPDFKLKGTVDAQIPRPYALMYQRIPESSKDVEHVHLDMVFFLEANDDDETTAQLEEVHDAGWHTKQEILSAANVFDAAKGFAALNLV